MNLQLVRQQKIAPGIFSLLLDSDDKELFVTLEHSYQYDDEFEAKIPNGSYVCKRGIHSLDGVHKFETFEVTGVEGHTGLLFHWGNWEENSKGCILLGKKFADSRPDAKNQIDMVTSSRIAFAEFMELQHGCDTFILEVR